MNYNTLNRFLHHKFGCKVIKICVDGGFTCPNRDGRCGVGGCDFCNSFGSGEHIATDADVYTQIDRFVSRLSPRMRTGHYLVYFQNFTNTYADTDTLRRLYTTAISYPGVCALAIATRPDCIDEDVCALLAEIGRKVYLWVELGLQTASDKTAAYFNRGYQTSVYTHAVRLLASRGVDVVTHLIIGLPHETMADFESSIALVNSQPLQGVKLHSLYVADDTRFADMYRRGEFFVQTEDEYIDWVLYAITHLDPNFVLHRLMGTCTPDTLIAPHWNTDKNRILRKINQTLESKGWYQGIFFIPDL